MAEPMFNILNWPHKVAKDSVVAEFTVPTEPVSKQRPRAATTSRGQHFYTPAQTAENEFITQLAIKQAAPELFPDDAAAFGVRMQFFSGTRQRRDIDNMAKLIMDACTGIAWKDDSQVHEMHLRRFLESDDPRTEVVIYKLAIPAIPMTICIICHKEFRAFPSWSARRYCSKACSGMAHRKRIEVACLSCKTSIIRTPSTLKGNPYCSKDCKTAHTTRILECANCKTAFSRPQSLIKGPVSFCSEECMAEKWENFELRTTAGRGTCEHCGRPTSKTAYTRCQACRIKQSPTRSPGAKPKGESKTIVTIEELA